MSSQTIRSRLTRLERVRATRRASRPDRQALDRLRADPARVLSRPDPWQAALLRALPPRTLAVCSRQSGKSTTAAGCCLTTALLEPGSLTLILSPTLRQSQELFRKVLTLYRAHGRPVPAAAVSKTALELVTGSRVVALPGDPDGIVGFSAPRLVVIDEAARVTDELYQSVRPMLATSGGKLLLCSTPFGRRGFLWREWSSETGNSGTEPAANWHRVEVPATACPRIGAAFLEQERRALGERWFRQEYLCDFAADAGAVFAFDDVLAAGVDSAPDWVQAA
ncbi:terminase large subunit domain-containing protein [Urbifossiella limnaea]|uniref:Terminase n=1 Tax=Urbifossiella limnaea TaxID=2528023 RepID=A0A517Y2S0_9BACT|nr:terminase large subunit [Urbifossiella limnaea]QDU24032.1 hypothetical protein ETAA1_60430 [Urbifossiella limnaea]